MSNTIAQSFIEHGNLTRGQFGDIPHPIPVEWNLDRWEAIDVDLKIAAQNAHAYTWGAWDSDFGFMAPWPANDIVYTEEA